MKIKPREWLALTTNEKQSILSKKAGVSNA